MNPTSRRLILIPLLLASIVLQVRRTQDVVSTLDARPDAARPFEREEFSNRLTSVNPEAEKAGLAPGHRLVAVEGKPIQGSARLSRKIHEASPGDTLRVTVQTEEGNLVDAEIRLEEKEAGKAGDVALRVILGIAMPWLCVGLGFWAALVRPGDRRAWLLLWLMVGMANFGGVPAAHWPAGLNAFASGWYTLLQSTWPAAMLFFGVHFPDRLELDRKFPWVNWLIAAPLLAMAAVRAALAVAEIGALPSIVAIGDAIAPLRGPIRFLDMTAISLFFMALGVRHARPMDPDARRRLAFLQVGTSLALGPTFLLILLGIARGVDAPDAAPSWVTVPSFLLIFLFPATLAYTVVVHRSLDVRVAIRQGLRYAFARRSIFALRVGLTIAILLWTVSAILKTEMRRVDVLGAIAFGGLLVVLLQRIGDWTLRWTDRRFFRESLDAERILAELADEVRSVVETGPLVEIVAKRLSESLHVERVAVLLREGDDFVAAGPSGLRIPASRVDSPAPVRLRDDDPDLRDFGAEILLPLAAKDRVPGVVVLGPRRAEAPYAASELRLLRSVGAQVGLALENARLTAAVAAEVAQRSRLAREVEIAREVQERLFPQSIPVVEGLDLAGHCRTALEVGGDYYDFLSLPDGSLLLALGDVSGKGIGAALVMASLQASLRGQSFRAAGELASLVAGVNALVLDATADNRYATLFVARWDPSPSRLHYVNAGHNAPFVLRAGGEVERLEATGTVVGLVPGAAYGEAAVDLAPGDLLAIYTDGVSEAMNLDDEEFGEERLLASLRACAALSPDETIRKVLADADAFASGAPQHDDMTLVIARRRRRA